MGLYNNELFGTCVCSVLPVMLAACRALSRANRTVAFNWYSLNFWIIYFMRKDFDFIESHIHLCWS